MGAVARTATGESSLARAVRLLAAFDHDEQLTVSELGRRAGLPLPTASRLVAELTRLGLLERDEHRRVRVGLRLWELAARASAAQSLREVAKPYLDDLQAVVGHHTQLAVLEGEDVLFLERLTARGAVKAHTRVGGRLPVHASSAGVVLLAHAPAEVQAHILSRPLARFTPQTVTDPAGLRRLLADVRRSDLAVLEGHLNLGATGIAVPVREAGRRQVTAALSVIVPSGPEATAAVPALRAAARGLGRALAEPRPRVPKPRKSPIH